MGNIIQSAVINKTSIPNIEKLLNLSATRHKLIASNVANVTTPGYKSKSIDFDTELKKALEPEKSPLTVTNERHIPLSSSRHSLPEIKEADYTENGTGINSVDIDSEMADLAQNQLVFELGAKLITDKFTGLKSAIRGRAI